MIPEPFQSLSVLLGALFFIAAAGAAFALGFGLICRKIGWAPVNLHVHTHIHQDEP